MIFAKEDQASVGQNKLVLYEKVDLLKVIKIIAKPETIVAIQGNIKELHIQYATYAVKKVTLF